MSGAKRTRFELLTHRGTLITMAALLVWGLLGALVSLRGDSPGVAWFAGTLVWVGVERVGRNYIPEVKESEGSR